MRPDILDEIDIDDPEEDDMTTKMHKQNQEIIESWPSNVLISFLLNLKEDKTYQQLNDEIVRISGWFADYANIKVIVNGKYINDKDNEDISIEKYRATPVFISLCLMDLFGPRGLYRSLYFLVYKYGRGEIAFTTKKKDGTFDVRYYKKKELTCDGLKKIQEPFNKFYEEIKDRTKNIEWGGSGPEEYFFVKNVGGEKTFKFNPIYHCGGLMMYNFDSETKLNDDCLKYMSRFINKWLPSDTVLPTPDDLLIKMFPCSGRKPDIPIILKKDVPDYETLWKGIDTKRKTMYVPKGSVLGYYTRDNEKGICNGPHIVLCPENIKSSSESYNIPFKVLITKTLVHEIGHALMDKYRIADSKGTFFMNTKKNWSDTLEAKAMEESLANAITLNAFRQHAPNDYKRVHHFIDEMQSSIYKFGLWQEKINADWTKWRNHSKKNTKKLQKWFNKCFNAGHIVILQEDYTQELFNKVFSEDQKAAQ